VIDVSILMRQSLRAAGSVLAGRAGRGSGHRAGAPLAARKSPSARPLSETPICGHFTLWDGLFRNYRVLMS
jgi:hypothetical protein